MEWCCQVKVVRGKQIQNRFGLFHLSDLIGRPYGSKVVSLLVEAGLPFGKEVANQGLPHDSPAAFR